MPIRSIPTVKPPTLPGSRSLEAPRPLAGAEAFARAVTWALGEVNRRQQQVARDAARFAAGEPVDLQRLLADTEEAELAFQLVIQVRNKVLEAYREVMGMQL